MKNWQKERNYRKRRRPDGSVAYFITVDGVDYEVDKPVYDAYSTMDRRERYLEDEQGDGILLSLERFAEDDVQLAYLTDRQADTAEDTALRNILTTRIYEAVQKLDGDEKYLLRLLFLEGISVREIARREGIYHHAVAFRRDRILRKLKKFWDS